MKNNTGLYATLLIVGVLLIANISFGQGKNFIDKPYIETTGTIDTLVTPDEIYIKIVLSERETKDKKPLEDMERAMVEALKNQGIDVEKSLTTSDMLSNYKSYLLKQKDIIKTKEYILKVSNAETASRIFIELENSGISNTSIDRVNHNQIEGLKNICRTKAIIEARDKAKIIAKPLGQSIGNAIHIVDVDIDGNFDKVLQGRLAGVQIGYGSVKNKLEPPKIEFEKIKVSASIQAKFALN